jgi:hypothetical protein
MGLAWRNALSAPHHTGSPPGTISSGTACTTWMGPSGGAACAFAGLHTWGSASCAAMRWGLGSVAPSAPALCCYAAPTSSVDGTAAPAAED